MPRDNSLLQISQEWSSNSKLGNLRTKKLNTDDIEARIWSGFGLLGTKGIVLQRSNGAWNGFKVNIESCHVLLPDTVNSEAEIREFKNKVYVSECEPFPKGASGQIIAVDSVITTDLPRKANITLWNQLKAEGLLTLPPEVERSLIVMDGHSYVIEIKKGSVYRASVIDNPRSKIKADRQMQTIVKTIDQRLGTRIDGRTW